MIGSIIGNIYQITEKLGEGGMGAVYKGIDLNLQRPVAIKVLRSDLANQQSLVERFRIEAVTLARLNHPNIATLYAFLTQKGQYFMIMEFVVGETLDDILRRKGAMPYIEAIPIFCQSLEGMDHAHQNGIVHRDIKPANLMVVKEHRGLRVKVMDFGIARILGSNRMTRTGGVIGTLHYMSPEQAQSLDTDARSDIYSLGILLYEMLTGRVPFNSHSEYELMKSHIEKPPPPLRSINAQIPEDVENAVLKAIAKSPADRFQSVTEFRDTLQAILNQAPQVKVTEVEPLIIPVTKKEGPILPPHPLPSPVPLPNPSPTFFWQLSVGVFVGLVVITGLCYFAFFAKPEPKPAPTNVVVLEPILRTRPVPKDMLLQAIKDHPTEIDRIAKEVHQLKVNFEMTPELEQQFIAAGASSEMVSAVRSNYFSTSAQISPTPSASPTSSLETVINNDNGGVDVKPVQPIVEPPVRNGNNTVKKMTDIEKRPDPTPTMRPKLPIANGPTRAELERRLNDLKEKVSNADSDVERERLRREVEQVRRQLANAR